MPLGNCLFASAKGSYFVTKDSGIDKQICEESAKQSEIANEASNKQKQMSNPAYK